MPFPQDSTTLAPATIWPDQKVIVEEIRRRAAAAGPAASFCPSEVARGIAGPHPEQWAPLMQPVRRAAVELARDGKLVIYRKGRPVDPTNFKGIYRLGAPRQD
jgi:hypothetical protein